MHTKKTGVVFIAFLLVFLSCEKTENTSENIAEAETSVELPPSDWTQSLYLLPLQISEGDSESAALQEFYALEMMQGLSRMEKVKVMPAPPQKQKTYSNAPLQIQGTIGEIKDDTLQIHVSISNSETGEILFEDNQSIPQDLFVTGQWIPEEEMAHAIGRPVRQTENTSDHTPDTEAVQLYKEGVDFLLNDSKSDVDLAIIRFKQALRIDSLFVNPLVGLSRAYLLIQENQWQPHIVWTHLALEAARKAMAMDPENPNAYVYAGKALYLLGDYQHAEENYKKAVRLNQSEIEAWKGLAEIYHSLGLYQTFLKVTETVLELNPADKEILIRRGLVELAYGQYRQAENSLLKAQNAPDKTGDLDLYLGMVYYYQNNFDKSLDHLYKSLAENKDILLAKAFVAMTEVKQKKPDDALSLVELDIKPAAYDQTGLGIAVAAVYCLLGRKTLAIEWIETAYRAGYSDYIWLVNDSNFDALRQETDFLVLLNKIKDRWIKRAEGYSL